MARWSSHLICALSQPKNFRDNSFADRLLLNEIGTAGTRWNKVLNCSTATSRHRADASGSSHFGTTQAAACRVILSVCSPTQRSLLQCNRLTRRYTTDMKRTARLLPLHEVRKRTKIFTDNLFVT
jgi:hypothetical protein